MSDDSKLWSRLFGALALCMPMLLGSACGGDPDHASGSAREAGRPKQVLLVTIDTLRASHLGCYGYDRPTSPFLDGLAEEGVQFMRAYAPIPRTTPSHMSLMTGLRPHTHGAIRNSFAIVAERPPSMPERFRQRGFATAAFVSIPFLDPRGKRLPGFDHVEVVPVGEEWRAEEVFGRAVRWIRSQGSRPLFVWVHAYDPHKPYAAPGEYRERFWKGPEIDYVPPRTGLLTGPPPTALEAEYMAAMYDAEIRYTDEALRDLVETLDAPLAVITSDHGEVLAEHAADFGHAYFHGKYPFHESLRVPLIFHWPGRVPPGRRTTPIDLTGLAATMVEVALGESLSTEVPSFASLLRQDVSGDGEDAGVFGFAPKLYPGEKVIPGWEFRRREAWSLIRWPWHVIHHPDRGDLLFDVSADPLEQRDLAATHPEKLRALRDEVVNHFSELPEPSIPEMDVDPALQEQLRSLGYVD